MLNKSSLYWLARAQADEKRAQRIADGAAKEIKKMYRRQYLNVVKQLESLNAQLDAGKELTRTQLWNYSRWRQLENELKQFVDESTRISTETANKALEEVFTASIGTKSAAFQATRLTAAVEPRQVIGTDWSGVKFSDRIWKNNAAIADRIKHSMEDMLVQGRGLPDIKKAIMQEFNVAYNQADRIVRTEAAYVLNRAHVAQYKAEGTKKIVWDTGMEDGKICEICRVRANKVYLIDEAPIIPAHPRCRCLYSAIVEIGDENVPVDGPEAEQEIALMQLTKKEKRLQTAAKNGKIEQETELGRFKKTLQGDKNISKDYHNALKSRFSHGSDKAKSVFNQYASGNTVAETNYINTPFFDPKTKKVHMNYAADLSNERGKGVTYFHEHGHLIDDACGYISHDVKFMERLKADRLEYAREYGRKNGLNTFDKVDAAISGDLNSMRKHSGVSDILGAISNGNIAGIAGHSESYWNENSICEEAFAHMFECQFDPMRKKEMQKYFPSSLKYFEETILKGVDGK